MKTSNAPATTPGKAQRECHPEENLELVGPHDGRGLGQLGRLPKQVGHDRKDHEGDKKMAHPHHHAEPVVEHLHGAETERSQKVVDHAGVPQDDG